MKGRPVAADNPTPGQDPANEPGQAQDATPGYGQQPDTQQPPWGEDFQPEKAWNLVQNLRGDKQQLQQQADEFRQSHELWQTLNSDQQAQEALFRELAGNLGYDLEDPNADPGDQGEGDDPQEFHDPRVDQMLQQQEEQAIAQKINQHIDRLAQDAGVELTDSLRNALTDAAWRHQNPQHTEQLAQALFEDLKGRDKRTVEQYVQGKRAPRPPGPGVPGSEKFDITNRDQRLQQMAAAAQAAQDQQ